MATNLFALSPIGFVRTGHHDLADTPIQTFANPSEEAFLELLDQYAPGLEGLDEFDFAVLVTVLDRVWDHTRKLEPAHLRPIPFMLQESGERVGVFATRFPVRPNPIAISLVRVLGVQGTRFDFAGVDLLDGTPVVDIKPWVPRIDIPAPWAASVPGTVRTGWYERVPGAPPSSAGERSFRDAGILPNDQEDRQ